MSLPKNRMEKMLENRSNEKEGRFLAIFELPDRSNDTNQHGRIFDLSISPHSVTHNEEIVSLNQGIKDMANLVAQNAENIKRFVWISVLAAMVILGVLAYMYTKLVYRRGRNKNKVAKEENLLEDV